MSADRLEERLESEDDTVRLGARLARLLAPGDLVLLEGELGAGKTFLARAIAEGLEVDEPVTSPTFAIVHELPGRMPLVHADLYRLARAADIEETGLLSYLGGDAVVLVEWGEKFIRDLGTVALVSRLSIKSVDARDVSLIARSDRGCEILAGLRAG